MLQQPKSAIAVTNLGRYTTVRCPPLSPILAFGQKARFPTTAEASRARAEVQMAAAEGDDARTTRTPLLASGMAAATDAEEESIEQKKDATPSAAGSALMQPSLSASSYSGTSRQSSMDMDKMIRPKRKRINPQQLETLLGMFAHTDTPSYELRDRIGTQLGMSNREVQVWFQNRRAKERSNRQKQLNHEAEQASGLASTPVAEEPLAPAVAPVGPRAGISVFSTAVSSPPRSMAAPLPGAVRRRSLSTSVLISGVAPPASQEDPLVWIAEDAERGRRISSAIGPVRPSLGRHHTHAGNSFYGRPSHTIGSRGRSGPTSSSVSPTQSTRPRTQSFRAAWSPPFANSSLPRRHAALAHPPSIPQGASAPYSTASYRPSAPSFLVQPIQGEPSSVAERRQNRLPPIKLLIDEIDTAMRDIPTNPFGPSTVQSCPSLLSPFQRLELQSPLGNRTVHSEGSMSYFDQQRTPMPEQHSPPGSG